MSDTSDPLEILNAIDRERGDSSIGMIQANQVQRLRDEIVALRHYKHENHEASEVIRRAAELVRTQMEGAFSDAKREVRNAALEDAAQRCDRLATDYTIPVSADNWSAGCRGCAGRVRALKGER